MQITEIHPADKAERDLAAKLLADSEPWITLKISYEQCIKNCHNPDLSVYIAYSDKSPAGIILVDPNGVAGSPYLKSIAVWPEFRDRGIGTELLSFAENLFRGISKHFFLCVSSFNKRAQEFYEKNGYKVIGELTDYIIEGESEILLYKRL